MLTLELKAGPDTGVKLLLQEMVAASLGVPANRIMCHVKRVGGAFGGKLLKAGLLASVASVAANK